MFICNYIFSLQILFPYMGFLGRSNGKKYACNVGEPGFDLWAGKIPWKRAWQPTPVFLPGDPHGQRSLAGYSLWVRKLDTTERPGTAHGTRSDLARVG